MLDPFFAPPPGLVEAIQPVADYLNLSTLPLHIHEVLFAWVCYSVINAVVAPRISAWLCPETYPYLPRRTTINWNNHVTSMIQAIFISTFALVVIWKDEERKNATWVERIFGYDGAVGAVQSCAAGYFLWDLVESSVNLDVLGWGSIAHAASALLVTSLGFRPFANHYGLNFILYEISNPFMNMHWFFDKLQMTGSKWQLYNGIVLLITFFSCRVAWGNYQSICIYSDIWSALSNGKMAPDGHDALPVGLAFLYAGSNTVLSFLNVYWYGLMIQALRSRFQEPDTGKGKNDAELKVQNGRTQNGRAQKQA